MKKFFISIISLGILMVWLPVQRVSAQSFKFELGTASDQIAIGTPFDLKILINTAGQQTINGDALFSYDPAAASINSASKDGLFFTYISASPLGGANNKYLVSSWEESVAHAKSSSAYTLFAVLNTTLKSSCATFTYDCTAGTESDSNINRASDSKDIIVCPLTPITVCAANGTTTSPTPSVTGAAVTGEPTTAPASTATPIPTSTPTPTITPLPTSTPIPTNTPLPTVSELPRSGAVEVTVMGLGIGAFLLIAGLFMVGI